MALNGFEAISTHAQHRHASPHARTASVSATTDDVDELENDELAVGGADVEMEDEDEVDELDSDLDEEDNDEEEAAPVVNGSGKSKSKKLGERTPGTSLLPVSRVESILDADGMSIFCIVLLLEFAFGSFVVSCFERGPKSFVLSG